MTRAGRNQTAKQQQRHPMAVFVRGRLEALA